MNNITFPKLGISLNISPVAFSIGSKPIYWYALIILSGFLLGLFFVYKTCEKRCLLYTSPSPRDRTRSRMPSSA